MAGVLLNFRALLLSCSSMDASAPPYPTAARAILGASIMTAAVCALPHAMDERAVLDTSSVGAAATGPPHPRADDLRFRQL